jgi:hypothetical protein
MIINNFKKINFLKPLEKNIIFNLKIKFKKKRFFEKCAKKYNINSKKLLRLND